MTQAESTNSVQTPRSKGLLTWMIVSQILAVLPMLAGAGFAVFGYLLDGKISFYMFAYYLSPLLGLIPLVASWVAYSKRNEKAAWILTSIPILYVCADGVVLLNGIFF